MKKSLTKALWLCLALTVAMSVLILPVSAAPSGITVGPTSYTLDGNPVPIPQPGGNLAVKVPVTGTGTAKLFLALYENENNVLTEVQTSEAAVLVGGSQDLTASITIPDLTNHSFRVYVWDVSNENLIPLEVPDSQAIALEGEGARNRALLRWYAADGNPYGEFDIYRDGQLVGSCANVGGYIHEVLGDGAAHTYQVKTPDGKRVSNQVSVTPTSLIDEVGEENIAAYYQVGATDGSDREKNMEIDYAAVYGTSPDGVRALYSNKQDTRMAFHITNSELTNKSLTLYVDYRVPAYSNPDSSQIQFNWGNYTDDTAQENKMSMADKLGAVDSVGDSKKYHYFWLAYGNHADWGVLGQSTNTNNCETNYGMPNLAGTMQTGVGNSGKANLTISPGTTEALYIRGIYLVETSKLTTSAKLGRGTINDALKQTSSIRSADALYPNGVSATYANSEEILNGMGRANNKGGDGLAPIDGDHLDITFYTNVGRTHKPRYTIDDKYIYGASDPYVMIEVEYSTTDNLPSSTFQIEYNNMRGATSISSDPLVVGSTHHTAAILLNDPNLTNSSTENNVDFFLSVKGNLQQNIDHVYVHSVKVKNFSHQPLTVSGGGAATADSRIPDALAKLTFATLTGGQTQNQLHDSFDLPDNATLGLDDTDTVTLTAENPVQYSDGRVTVTRGQEDVDTRITLAVTDAKGYSFTKTWPVTVLAQGAEILLDEGMNYPVGQPLANQGGWVRAGSSEKVTANIIADPDRADNTVLDIYVTGNHKDDGNQDVYHNFAVQDLTNEKLTVEARMKMDTAKRHNIWIRGKDNNPIAQIYLMMKENRITLDYSSDNGGAKTMEFKEGVSMPKPGEWFTLKLVFDAATDTYDMYIDGKQANAQHLGTWNGQPITEFKQISFFHERTDDATNAHWYLDDILVRLDNKTN